MYKSLRLFVCVAVSAVLFSSANMFAQSFNVTMNQDAFFGFYPTVGGSAKLNESTDFTFYGIFWTSPGLGSVGAGNLWTEFGAGADFKVMNDQLHINPMLGFTNGRLQSQGARGVLFEGLVPSLTVNLATEKLEGQLYAGYYLAVRSEGTSQNNFLHYWIHGGYKVSSLVSLGVHFESLSGTAIPAQGASTTNNIYTWYGGYVQFASKGGHTLRFTGGGASFGPSATSESGNFYKMSVGIPFAM